MAVPHVAGAAALYLERYPDAAPAEVAEALYRSATPGAIQDSRMRPGTVNRMLYTLPLLGVGGPDGSSQPLVKASG